jgi:hypothetical protein
MMMERVQMTAEVSCTLLCGLAAAAAAARYWSRWMPERIASCMQQLLATSF